MPPLGGPHRDTAILFGCGNTRMVWLQDGEDMFEDMFTCSCFDKIPDLTDGQTCCDSTVHAMPGIVQ